GNRRLYPERYYRQHWRWHTPTPRSTPTDSIRDTVSRRQSSDGSTRLYGRSAADCGLRAWGESAQCRRCQCPQARSEPPGRPASSPDGSSKDERAASARADGETTPDSRDRVGTGRVTLRYVSPYAA